MGAECEIWVQVETKVTEWRKSYGVTGDDALENVRLEYGESLTGVYTYDLPDEDYFLDDTGGTL